MNLLLYRGKSIWSYAIKIGTRSLYSHAAVEFSTGTVIEAWGTLKESGVFLRSNYREGHTEGTLVDVFKLKQEPLAQATAEKKALAWAMTHTGDDYDWAAIGGFIRRSRIDYDNNDDWICSELTEEVFNIYCDNDESLLRGPSSHHSPGHLAMSNAIEFIETRVV